jgi:hypothetical protein
LTVGAAAATSVPVSTECNSASVRAAKRHAARMTTTKKSHASATTTAEITKVIEPSTVNLLSSNPQHF